MSKYEHLKFWVQDHQDEIIVVSLGVFVIGLFAVVVKSDMTYREQLNVELNAYIDELNAFNRIKELTDS